MTRTPQQNRRIWALARDLSKERGISEEDAQDVVRRCAEEVSGQRSTRALTVAQAAAVIGRLAQLVAAPSALRAADPAGMVTADQQEALSRLLETLGMDTRAYRGVCMRTIKVPWPQTREQAGKVYEGLEAMLRRRYKVEQLAELAQHVMDWPGVSPQDHAFAASILAATRRKKRMGAGQIGILIKIGGRYGFSISIDKPVFDNR